MRIGLVCPYSVVAGGGVQECVFALADELIARGHYVRVLSPRPRGFKGEAPKHVVFIGLAAKVSSFHTTSQISASAEGETIDSVLKEHKFDVLHFHEPWVPFVSRQILTRSTSCNVATFHAKLPENRMNKTIEKVITPYTSSILKYLDSLTAVSDAAADYVKTICDREIKIIPNGIDLEKYKPDGTNKTSKTKKIVFIGRLERRKGVKHLINAFAVLGQTMPKVQLHIGGTGPEESSLKKHIEELGVKNVKFHGYISGQAKINLMSSADVFCSPALYGESFGIVLLEAMSLGVPIVAGDNPGYQSVMKDRGNISIVNPKNTDLFAKRLELLMTDTQLRTLWQEWAREYVKQFSYVDIVDSYELMYEQTCKNKGKMRR
jgi:phosphatidyl-myo-inositol alpha-mannosyltransferase